MDVVLCQRMLCDHGIFPYEVIRRPFKERLLMLELLKNESKELKGRSK